MSHARSCACMRLSGWDRGEESGKSTSDERNSINKKPKCGEVGPVFGE